MYDIFELQERMDLFKEAVEVFWGQWGTEKNYHFYYDCMLNSLHRGSSLPRFYIAVQNEKNIIGTYGLLRNDLISRQDLFPWLASLFVVPEQRGNQLGSILLQHAVHETAKQGFDKLYLCTDLEGYYEKYNWDYMTDGYAFNGDPTKIYVKSID